MTSTVMRAQIVCVLKLLFLIILSGVETSAARDYAVWTISKGVSTVSWSSHKKETLSEWKTADCVQMFGPNFLLTGLTGYKDPWGNLDEFIARLDATCTELDAISAHKIPVFTSKNHREQAYELNALDWKANPDLLCKPFDYAGPLSSGGTIGAMEIETNPAADYVKNIRFFVRCPRMLPDKSMTWDTIGDTNRLIPDWGSNWEFLNLPKERRLACPGQDFVVSGIEVRFEIGKGKIHDVRLQCRQLFFKP